VDFIYRRNGREINFQTTSVNTHRQGREREYVCSIMARVPAPRKPIETLLLANTFLLTSLKMYKLTRCRKCLPNLSALTGGVHFEAISSISSSLSPRISQMFKRLTKSNELILCSYLVRYSNFRIAYRVDDRGHG